ncbi:TldD/PmbA family protein [Pseudomarimonas arenosa]|uniref:TldD/PmbA family protein n=1 Tax=Pseudomarimonas arenosa TaxID=2774145 RepID=A0AAW3ZKD6_9GAMM|nr:TldD/PmbA family protein [Pseudomarimonas arenosa]MBD8525370.1 TldD/PmbA family protein [Pseudomarimonas arenosa]
MTMMSETQAKAILDKVMKLSKAEECSATLQGGVTGNIRFARNEVSTSGQVEQATLVVQVSFGKKVGIATIESFDDASLERVVRRAEELANLAPDNPEFMPIIDKQTYKLSNTWNDETASLTPEFRTQVAADCIEPCRNDKLVAAGFFTDNAGFVATANSKGNFGYQRITSADLTCTVRTDDEQGSGWVASNVAEIKQFDAKQAIKTGMSKAKGSRDAKALEPGKYTVILEPAAAAGLINFMLFGFDARQSDEGRSFLSKKGGGNKIGEKVFDSRVNVYSDPWEPGLEVLPWDGEGLARERTQVVKDGVVEFLQYSRFWAKEKGKSTVGQPGNLIVTGGTASTDEMVKSTKKGILVTRTWYIRLVDPQTMLLTGLTRDGTFYIEDGEIKYPIKNFRFNESPVIMLNNIEELGKSVRLNPDESPFIMKVPPMKIRDFTFTSLSDAV